MPFNDSTAGIDIDEADAAVIVGAVNALGPLLKAITAIGRLPGDEHAAHNVAAVLVQLRKELAVL